MTADLVNAVGGGELNEEIDLDELYNEIEGEDIRYDPEYWPGLYVRFTADSPVILLFRTGKYNIAGADSVSELREADEKITSLLQSLGIGENVAEFEVRNLVLLNRYSRELNLEQLMLALGLENSEYDPEQFPGLVYDCSDTTGTFIIFTNGKVILTGATDLEKAKSDLERLFTKLDTLFDE
jgi:TATA-box binding protein (TBP), component of TFIID and TFIIIB